MLSSLKEPVLNQVGSCLKFYLFVIMAVYTEVKGGSTRKFNCPFQLVGKYSNMCNSWTLRVICEEQNHEPSLDMEGHPYAMRLFDNETRLVVDLLRKGVKPHATLLRLKEQNPNNVSTIKTIYNACQKYRRTDAGRNSIVDCIHNCSMLMNTKLHYVNGLYKHFLFLKFCD